MTPLDRMLPPAGKLSPAGGRPALAWHIPEKGRGIPWPWRGISLCSLLGCFRTFFATMDCGPAKKRVARGFPSGFSAEGPLSYKDRLPAPEPKVATALLRLYVRER